MKFVQRLCSLISNNLEIAITMFRPLAPAEIAITAFRTLAHAEIVVRLCLQGDCCTFVSILRPSDDEENEGTPDV